MSRIPAVEVSPGSFMPLVSVQTVILGTPRQFTALVDSGADYTVVPARLLVAYGVDVRSLPQGRPSVGANGTPIPTWVYDMDLMYRGRLFAASVGVLPSLPGPILGRDDFMRKFTVHMHWSDNPPSWCATRVRNPR